MSLTNTDAAILVNDASLDLNSVNASTILGDLASGLEAGGRPAVAASVRMIGVWNANDARTSLRVLAASLVA